MVSPNKFLNTIIEKLDQKKSMITELLKMITKIFLKN